MTPTLSRIKEYHSPNPTVDIIIEHKGGIVLIERKNYPFGWAIPGGFVDYGETLEHAAAREAKEETNLRVRLKRQFHAYSDPKRDPRQHTISTVFIAEAKTGVLKGKDDARKAAVFTRKALPKAMAFDHAKVLKDYFEKKY